MDLDTTWRPAPKKRTRPAFDGGGGCFTAERAVHGCASDRDKAMISSVNCEKSHQGPRSTIELARQSVFLLSLHRDLKVLVRFGSWHLQAICRYQGK